MWRYMSLDKFLDLLTHQRLFFTNAANLTDSYEVSLPPNIVRTKRAELEQRGLSGRELAEELAAFEYTNQPMRELTLVNCWSMGRAESYALWKIYLGGSRAGVAIRTRFGRLKSSIIDGGDEYPEEFYASEVQYTDHLATRDLSRVRLITTKREFYEYEKELRLFIIHTPLSEGGVKTPYRIRNGRHVSVDLELLIDRIYLSPFVSSWFGDSLRKIVEKVAPSLAERLTVSSIRDR